VDTDWIEPADALRFIVRTLWPARPTLADEITDPGWFYYPKTMVDSGRATIEEHEITKRALKLFHEQRRKGAIQASGVFNGQGRRELIDRAEFARGSLDIFKQQLDCTILGHPTRMYLDVLVSRPEIGQKMRSLGGKQPRLRHFLKQRFKDQPVPEPGACPRKQLINDVLKADPTLKSVDEATMKRAIDAHNVSVSKASL
jgi:hypothetical protein